MPSEQKVKNPIPTSKVLGVRFHRLSVAESVGQIREYIKEGKPRQVCLANAYTLAVAEKDESLMNLLNNSDLVLADGMSIVWAGRWVGAALPQRVAGPDLMEALCAEASRKSYRIYLLGSTDDNLKALSEVLKIKYPNIQIAGMYSPPFCERLDEKETKKIIGYLSEAKADILFVSMSAPKQEKWIANNLTNIPIPVCIGVGAAFDFISGKIPRAPLWLRKTGFEWAHRLYCEPRRLWKRYLLGNMVFLSSLIWQRLVYKLSKPTSSSS